MLEQFNVSFLARRMVTSVKESWTIMQIRDAEELGAASTSPPITRIIRHQVRHRRTDVAFHSEGTSRHDCVYADQTGFHIVLLRHLVPQVE